MHLAIVPNRWTDPQKWCMEREVCTDDIDVIHLLNRMLERGLLHHCRLNKLVENSDTAYYRFPQDHFKVQYGTVQYGTVQYGTVQYSGPAGDLDVKSIAIDRLAPVLAPVFSRMLN